MINFLRFLPSFKSFVKDNIHLEKERMILRVIEYGSEEKAYIRTQEEKSCDRLMVGK